MSLRDLFIVTIALFFSLIYSPYFAFASGNIDSNYKYAWSNNVGYINFESVVVDDTKLSGYAWSKNAGWIRFDPPTGGVFNNNGDLSGYAWGEQLGWINFDNVSIDTLTGKFSGTATGTIIGILTFDCPNYCDVRTNWRPATVGIGGGISVFIANNAAVNNNINNTNVTPENTTNPSDKIEPIEIVNNPDSLTEPSVVDEPFLNEINNVNKKKEQIANNNTNTEPQFEADAQNNSTVDVEAYNEPLIVLPDQAGRLAWDFNYNEKSTGENNKAFVLIDVPKNAVSSEVTFYVQESTNQYYDPPKDDLDMIFSIDINAQDNKGDKVNKFLNPIKISINVPEDLSNRNDLSVYYLTEGASEWIRIDDVVFDKNTVMFYVDHLTRFAVFASNDSFTKKDDFKEDRSVISEKLENKLSEQLQVQKSKYLAWFLLVVLLLVFWFFYRKNK